VHDLVDRLRPNAGAREQLAHAVDDALGVVGRRRGELVRRERAVVAGEDEVGEGAADVDPDA
jgi:hypothetical protein